MQGYFKKEIEPNYLYYDPEILKILDKLDEFFGLTKIRPDLTEQSENELNSFIDEGFFNSAQELEKLVRKSVKFSKI